MTSFTPTGSTFEKLLKHEHAELKHLLTGAYCAYILLIAVEKLKFENFNDVIRAYRKYFRKSCLSMKYAEFSPLFTGANCAYVLLIAAEKLKFKNVNDVIRAYQKYFRKSCLIRNVHNLILYLLPQTELRDDEQ